MKLSSALTATGVAMVALSAPLHNQAAAQQSGRSTTLGPTSDSPLAPPPNGMTRTDPRIHVLLPDVIHVSPGQSIDGGAVVIADGRIAQVLSAGELARTSWPAAYIAHELEGHQVYAGLIDAFVEAEAPSPDEAAPGAHWNDDVIPHRSVLDGPGLSERTKESLREQGFTAAGLSPETGIFRGRGAVVSLGEGLEDASEGDVPVYRADAFHALGFDNQGRAYPNSHMGAVAVVRQTLSDAAWSAANESPGTSSLHALSIDAPLMFHVDHEIKAVHAAEAAAEAGRGAMIVGSGREYWRLADLEAAGVPIVAPVNWPETPDVFSPGAADVVELRDLMHWEQAPTNPWRLGRAGLTVALTTAGLERTGDFLKNVRTSIDTGLTPEEALGMLTTTPARMLGVIDDLGTIEAGKVANLVVTTGPLFKSGTEIRDVWTDGRRHEISVPEAFDGTWDAELSSDVRVEFTVNGNSVSSKPAGAGEDAKASKARNVKTTTGTISFVVDSAELDTTYSISGTLQNDGTIRGNGYYSDGGVFSWTASRRADEADEDTGADTKDDADDTQDIPDLPGYPFGPYAMDGAPSQADEVLIRNATVWTSGDAGIIEDGWVHIRRGKINAIGSGNPPRIGRDAAVIDANGKHVTPGLIDAHSHTGTYNAGFNVNESGQAVTAEVRVQDAFDPGHINWYRQLGGGVTSALILHGSANPIGGQSLAYKNRWGAKTLRGGNINTAPGGIKFALGENVVRSNGGQPQTRYPKTRMGVETIMRDRFHAAERYAEARANDPEGTRRNLELDAIAQILAGDRFVHCHSYRQDEILMLARIAQDFGFIIGTYQHILEGYKVAEVLREVAKGASAFADWWGYKFEVIDAIPSNGAIMWEAGVNVSFNSDDDSLARRLNHEAAKAVRYGGVPRAEALKMVTINPAIQIGIDDVTGSLEPGKDADIVLWSGDPLSTLSRCEAVWIDGRQYFSLEQDRTMRERNTQERHRLLTKILSVGKPEPAAESEEGGAAGDRSRRAGSARGLLARMNQQRLRNHYIAQYERGMDPTNARCGDCGCGLINIRGY
ncbi:MAG: amidohydrolase family protein [Planctomycetota bacterium]